MPPWTLYRYFLILQVFLGLHCYGQPYKEDSLFDKFRNDILIEQQENRGRIVFDDDTRETYYTLLLTHPIDILAKYTDDSIPAVRAEIFRGLAQINADEKILKEVLNKHLTDTAKFTVSPTDVVLTWSVREDMESVMRRKLDNELPDIDVKARLEKLRREREYSIVNIAGGARHGIIFKDSLIRVDSLTSRAGFKVISFMLTIRGKTTISKNVLTKQIKEAIRELKSGERLYFESIKVEGPDKAARVALPIFLKIK